MNQSPFMLGTGEVITAELCKRIEATIQKELIIVTCFWARSASASSISDLLIKLSAQALRLGKIYNVRLCFSSLSFLSKLFHTRSPDGQLYPASSWARKLGLPKLERLQGLDLRVKSIFILPLSVMHSKYMIVDRHTAMLPSCNISWENWLEGCLTLQGPSHTEFVTALWVHWQGFWGRGGFGMENKGDFISLQQQEQDPFADEPESHIQRDLAAASVVLVTSPYHVNPRFRPLPLEIVAADPPETPLNNHTLKVLRSARKSIFMTTANLTSFPAWVALDYALLRGVDVTVVTNDRLMTLEQLLTAGTTTPWIVRKLIQRHEFKMQSRLGLTGEERTVGLGRFGNLSVAYFDPGKTVKKGEAVKIHLKLTIVDDKKVILGSGNMDRASWYTSQEVGIGIESAEVAAYLKGVVGDFLKDKTRPA